MKFQRLQPFQMYGVHLKKPESKPPCSVRLNSDREPSKLLSCWLFHSCVRKIRTGWIYRDFSFSRIDDQIHVFHRNCSQQDFITEHQSTNITKPIFEGHFDWPDIRHALPATVSDRNFPHRISFELKLYRKVFGNTKH